MRKVLVLCLSALILFSMCSCVSAKSDTESETNITIFAAVSLKNVMDPIKEEFQKIHPEVVFTESYDSSGTLMQQIMDGFECDIFFSAGQKQMNILEESGLIADGTRADILNNQVVLISLKGSGTSVTGLRNIGNASSAAIAAGSVPAGLYTRQALVKAGILEETDDIASISSADISEAFGGLEINECVNAAAVVTAVLEGSNEVGTVYYSDLYGHEEDFEIIEIIPYELTGDVLYPAAKVINTSRNEKSDALADAFLEFLKSDTAKQIFAQYHFDIG